MGGNMAWLTLTEALDALRRRLESIETLTSAQRILIVEIVYHWQREFKTQKRVPNERRKCSSCGDRVPPVYVLDSQKHPTHIMCPRCWRREQRALQREIDPEAEWEGLLNQALFFEEEV
jgi:hypothetical protein